MKTVSSDLIDLEDFRLLIREATNEMCVSVWSKVLRRYKYTRFMPCIKGFRIYKSILRKRSK